MWLRILRDAPHKRVYARLRALWGAPQDEDVGSRSRGAHRTRVTLTRNKQSHETLCSPHRPSSETASGGHRPPHDPWFKRSETSKTLTTNGKSKEAERRETRSHDRTLTRCGRAERCALASRRPTTALAAANERHSSAPVRALPGTEPRRTGRYPVPAISSTAGVSLPHRPVVVPAGRFAQSRPGVTVTNRRPREPSLARCVE